MPAKLIQYAFSKGVLSRALVGRNDLESYDLGLADGLNFFIDYRGGATSRAGTEFVDWLDAVTGVLFPFFFNTDDGNTYILVFTPNKLRFIQNGAYVLEAAKTVSGIVDGLVSSTAHGYSNGDLIIIDGRTLKVTGAAANSYTVTTVSGSAAPIDSGATDSFRVYTLSTTYDAAGIQRLRVRQRRDEVIITSGNGKVRKLVRAAHTSWTLSAFNYGGSTISAPVGLTGTPSSSGSASVNFAVTAVDANGAETPLESILTVNSSVDYSTTAGSVALTWTPEPGARYYNIYRSIIFPSAAANSLGQQLGYIGKSFTPGFTDTNITPNFTLSPQIAANPFVESAIDYIEITAGGTGYTSAPTVGVSGGGGSGFVGLALIASGAVTGVLILNPGEDYSSPTVSFTGGGGSGAAATATLGPTSGLRPAVSAFYNQRFWLMGTTSYPMTLFAGRSNDIYNFNENMFLTPADPLSLEIESPELSPIRYAEVLNNSLFVFTDLGVWQMRAENGEYAISRRTQNGIGRSPPLPIDRELIFPLPAGAGVRALRPSNLPDYYVDVDLSIYAGDFFDEDDEIRSWAYARDPNKVVWAQTEKGRLLSLTYVPEHNVYAWAPHDTRGKVLNLTVVQEQNHSTVYMIVERDSGVFIERMVQRDFDTVEDMWSIDCALRTVPETPAATITLADVDDGILVTADSGVFSSGDVGSTIRAGGGRGVIIDHLSSTRVIIEEIITFSERKPQTDDYPAYALGDWSLAAPFTSVSGLHHLEGEVVSIFADGDDIGTATVEDGAVDLPVDVSYALVGLPYDGFVTTLPVTASDQVIDDRRKRVVGVGLRFEDTRMAQYGAQGHYYEIKERSNERVGEPTRFVSGIKKLTVLADWREDGQVTVRKEGPGAVSLLGVIYDVDIGDDPE